MKKLTTLFLTASAIACPCPSTWGGELDQLEKLGWEKLNDFEPKSATAGEEPETHDPLPLFVIENPGIGKSRHLIAGELRFSGVREKGFLEMWTVYPGDGRFFTRTLAAYGPMAAIEGDSDWREFALPFLGNGDEFPTRLEVFAVLPGGGQIALRNLALYQSESIHGLGWWTGESIHRFGAYGGAFFGLLGGLCGTLAGLGKARKFVLAVLLGIFVCGMVSVGTGLVAVFSGQPTGLWVPLFLFGGILCLVGGICFPLVRKTYVQRELRRIAAAG